MSSERPKPIQVRYEQGIHLPEPDIWLDPHRVKSRAFISHAHADHYARHHTIITSSVNARILDARFGLKTGRGASPKVGSGSGGASTTGRKGKIRREVETHEWHESFPIAENFEATLLPAGHVLGSAQIHIRRLSDGESLLYTGDFKLKAGLAAEAPEWKQADSLIMETTFGRRRYVLPTTEKLIARLQDFVGEALNERITPVLLGYSLGKAQELLAGLGHAGIEAPIMLHRSVFEMTEVYRELGVELPACQLFDSAALEKDPCQVLVFPPNAGRKMIPKPARYAMFSGWAIDPSARYRYRVDEAFPLSDHADYPDLLKYVELVQPRFVHTLHGFAADFARDLRARGYDAWSLVSDDQLELPLGVP